MFKCLEKLWNFCIPARRHLFLKASQSLRHWFPKWLWPGVSGIHVRHSQWHFIPAKWKVCKLYDMDDVSPCAFKATQFHISFGMGATYKLTNYKLKAGLLPVYNTWKKPFHTLTGSYCRGVSDSVSSFWCGDALNMYEPSKFKIPKEQVNLAEFRGISRA